MKATMRNDDQMLKVLGKVERSDQGVEKFRKMALGCRMVGAFETTNVFGAKSMLRKLELQKIERRANLAERIKRHNAHSPSSNDRGLEAATELKVFDDCTVLGKVQTYFIQWEGAPTEQRREIVVLLTAESAGNCQLLLIFPRLFEIVSDAVEGVPSNAKFLSLRLP